MIFTTFSIQNRWKIVISWGATPPMGSGKAQAAFQSIFSFGGPTPPIKIFIYGLIHGGRLPPWIPGPLGADI